MYRSRLFRSEWGFLCFLTINTYHVISSMHANLPCHLQALKGETAVCTKSWPDAGPVLRHPELKANKPNQQTKTPYSSLWLSLSILSWQENTLKGLEDGSVGKSSRYSFIGPGSSLQGNGPSKQATVLISDKDIDLKPKQVIKDGHSIHQEDITIVNTCPKDSCTKLQNTNSLTWAVSSALEK